MSNKQIAVDGVRISASKLPVDLRPLLKYSKEWCFPGAQDAYESMRQKSEAAIRKFVKACESKVASLEGYCASQRKAARMTDEVVLLKAIYQNFRTARSRLSLVEKRRA